MPIIANGHEKGYHVVSAPDLTSLAKRVEEMMALGFYCQYGVVVDPHSLPPSVKYLQTMTLLRRLPTPEPEDEYSFPLSEAAAKEEKKD